MRTYLKHKLNLSMLFTLLLCVFSSNSFAKIKIGDIYYNLYGDSAEVTSRSNSSDYSGKIVIPNAVTYNGKTFRVTSIRSQAFYYCRSLTSITIPESVICIGTSAFEGCSSLTSITISEGVTSIGSSAFNGCSYLTSFSIPESVTSIGSNAFDGTAWYSNQPDGLIYAGKVAYKYKGTMPDNTSIIITEGTKGIANYAFKSCSGLTSITIPEGVTIIGWGAFNNCSMLTSVSIPEGVTSVGGNAFDGTAWFSNQPDGLIYAGKVAYKYKGTMPDNTIITIKEGTTEISGYAFEDCSNLTSITIPEGVTCIENGTFNNCSGLTSIIIPVGVTSIGSYAFYGCSGLTSIAIPESVNSIGSYAFYGCSGLTSIAIPESVNSIGAYAFSRCSSLKSVTIPEGVSSIEDFVFSNCSGLTSIAIPESVTSIYSYAFAGCSSLTTITIPSSVTGIGHCAFYNCSGLTSIKLPENITLIADNTFNGCSSLISINIPDSVTHIYGRAFNGCSNLTSITLPKISNISFENLVFSGCTNLESLTISNNIKIKGSSTFNGCHLKNIIVKDIKATFDSGVFSDIMLRHTIVYVPAGKRWDAIYDSQWGNFNNIREMAMSVDEISQVKAYSLMDMEDFSIAVFDEVNGHVAYINSINDVDETKAANAWQIIKRDNSKYLYNIGSRKYAFLSNNGNIALSSSPVAIDIDGDERGFIFNNANNRRWGLVINEQVKPHELTAIKGVSEETNRQGYFTLDGLQTKQLKRGINIIRNNDGTAKKVVVK